MAEGDVIDIVEDDLEAAWTWLKGEAVVIYDAISPLWEAPLKAFEGGVVHRLWSAAAALVQKLLTVTSLADIETAFLNTIQTLGAGLLDAAKALGSVLLQSTLGLLQSKALSAA